MYAPVLQPAARTIASRYAIVEPFPFVPATCTIRSPRSGAPARSSSARVRPSFQTSSGAASRLHPTPRSQSENRYSQASASRSRA